MKTANKPGGAGAQSNKDFVSDFRIRVGKAQSGQDVALDPLPGEEGEAMTPIGYLASTDDDPVEILSDLQTSANRSSGLRNALTKLDPRSRRIIEARWLREEDQATLQDLANEYGVSAERIRQLESKALKSMRAEMGAV